MLQPISLRDICFDCYEKHNSDIDAAVQCTLRVLKTEAAYESIVDQILYKAVRYELRAQIMTEDRKSIIEGKDTVVGLRAMARQNLYDYPLVGGTKLGDADRETLDTSIHYHEIQEANARKKGTWLRAIHKKIGNKIVRDVLSLNQLRNLANEAGLGGSDV